MRPQLSRKIADKLAECIVKEIELGNTLLNHEIEPLANENICEGQQVTGQMMDHDHEF